MLVIRFNAGNDVNGNPRRCYALLSEDGVQAAWDEGYQGSGAIPEEYRGMFKGDTFETTVREYRALLKAHGNGRERGKVHRPLREGEDAYGRTWDLPANELCPTCGQPDSCGDCNHQRLSDADVRELQEG